MPVGEPCDFEENNRINSERKTYCNLFVALNCDSVYCSMDEKDRITFGTMSAVLQVTCIEEF